MRTNASTPFNEDGWSNLINDVRTLYLAVGGGANDMNFNSLAADQANADAGSTALQRAQNLADLTNVDEAIANLGLTEVVDDVSGGGSGSGGTFLRIANDLSDLNSVGTALSNLTLDKINFHAYGSGTQNVSADPETLQFNTERSDVGGYYNTGTYTYTPGVAGKYLCGFNITVEQSVSSDTDSFRAYFDHSDGNAYGHAWAVRTFINKKYSLGATALMAFNGSSENLKIRIAIDAAALSNNTVTLHEFWGIRISA